MPRVVPIFALCGLAGCLASFGPDLRPRGEHASVRVEDQADDCLTCHALESDAAHALEHGHPMPGAGAPLVADWMNEEADTCLTCHRLREGLR